MPHRATEYNRPQQIRDLTPQQFAAVPMLVAGSTDAEAGESLGIDRTTVFRWRTFSPLFQAEVNRQRAEQARLMADKLRAAAFQALDTILELAKTGDNATRLKAAVAILDRCASPCGPVDALEIVAAEESRRRRMIADSTDELLATVGGNEGIEAARNRIFHELEESATGNRR